MKKARIVEPPREAEEPQGTARRLQKAMYGMRHAAAAEWVREHNYKLSEMLCWASGNPALLYFCEIPV